MPGEWKNKNALQRLCIVRCLRPDRMTYAVRAFVEEKLGAKFVEARMVEFEKSFQETSSSTPVFFILSPGVDPLKVPAQHSFRIIIQHVNHSRTLKNWARRCATLPITVTSTMYHSAKGRKWLPRPLSTLPRRKAIG